MSFAKSVLMGCASSSASPSEDLRAVVVLGVEHAHEAQAGRAVEVAGVEEHGRDVDAALELLEQREGAVHREERAGPQDEDDVAQRVGVLGQAFYD